MIDKYIYRILGIVGIVIILVIIIDIVLCLNDIYFISLNLNINTENGQFVWNSIFKIVGALFVIWGLLINGKRLKEIAKTNEQSEKGHNITRFNSAIEHLSDKNLVISTGGVFELEELSTINNKYREISLKLLNSRLQVISQEIKEIIKDVEIAIKTNPKNKVAIEQDGYSKKKSLYKLRDTILNLIIEKGEEVFYSKQHTFRDIDFTNFDFKKKGHHYWFINCTFRHTKFIFEHPEITFENCYFKGSTSFELQHNIVFNDCWFEYVDIYNVNFGFVKFKGQNVFDRVKLIRCQKIEDIDFDYFEFRDQSFVQEELPKMRKDGTLTEPQTFDLFEFIEINKSIKNKKND